MPLSRVRIAVDIARSLSSGVLKAFLLSRQRVAAYRRQILNAQHRYVRLY